MAVEAAGRADWVLEACDDFVKKVNLQCSRDAWLRLKDARG